MTDNKPRVSIGMPVYNGGKYIRQALDSLLAQDYENFELIISDNASTDGTREICREYAGRDERISYYRNEENMGGVWNFHRVLELAQGKYFMWAAADDIWKPGFVSKMVNLLEATPSAVLAMCRTEKIDDSVLPLKLGPLYLTTTGMTRGERLRYFAQHASGWLTYGLYRMDVARAAMSVFSIKLLALAAFDVLFLHKCIDKGDLVFYEEVLFLKRGNPLTPQAKMETKSLSKMLGVLFWHCYGAFFKCYRFNGLSPREIGLIYWAIIQGLPQRSFYQHASRNLRRSGPIVLFRKVRSVMSAPLAWRSK